MAERIKCYDEISLKEEYSRQSLISASKFARRVGMSDKEYLSTLPQFPSKPKLYGSEFAFPLIVEGNRIPWINQADLSGIYVNAYLRSEEGEGRVKNWSEEFETPRDPIAVWVYTKFINKRPTEVRDYLLASRKVDDKYRAGTINASIALWNMRRSTEWNVIGAKVGKFGIPCLVDLHRYLGDPFPMLDVTLDNDASYRLLILDRTIAT